MTDLHQTTEVPAADPAGRRPMLLAATVLILAVVLVGGFAVAGSHDGGRPSTPSQQGNTAEQALSPSAHGDLSAVIAGLQATLKTSPDNDAAWATLGLDYVDQARVTVNPAFDSLAEGALSKSLALNHRDNFIADAGEAALAAARHQFAQAKAWALKGIAVDRYNAALYGALADAQTQLGEYADAAASVQKMIDLRPQTPALARASYVAELAGNLSSATSLMARARDAAASPADTAFADYYLGELARNAGDPTKALTYYNAGLKADPSYAALLEGRAKAEAALGRQAAAIADYTAVVGRVPQPQYVIEFGDYLQSLGKKAEAQQQYATFAVENTLFEKNGVLLDSDPALYYADHGNPAKALQYAGAGIKTRPFLEMDDAYAWALHVNGQDAKALLWSNKSLATGMKNALFHFHRGMIEMAMGERNAAIADLRAALRINPQFSPLQAPVAQRTLRRLGSAS